jgi:hypothetical protein
VKKKKISINGIGISLPEHAYIRAGISVGKETFGSRKAFGSFSHQKNEEIF